MFLRCLVLIVSFFLSACSLAEQKYPAIHHPSTQTFSFPKEVKPILIQEMLAIEKGMQMLLHSIVIADWTATEKTAKQIQSSYILKQSLTEEQKASLHHQLPKAFIKLDHSFHQFAGMLAHAAEVQNKDVVNFYYYKMLDTCTQCHSSYASERFLGFSHHSLPLH